MFRVRMKNPKLNIDHLNVLNIDYNKRTLSVKSPDKDYSYINDCVNFEDVEVVFKDCMNLDPYAFPFVLLEPSEEYSFDCHNKNCREKLSYIKSTKANYEGNPFKLYNDSSCYGQYSNDFVSYIAEKAGIYQNAIDITTLDTTCSNCNTEINAVGIYFLPSNLYETNKIKPLDISDPKSKYKMLYKHPYGLLIVHYDFIDDNTHYDVVYEFVLSPSKFVEESVLISVLNDINGFYFAISEGQMFNNEYVYYDEFFIPSTNDSEDGEIISEKIIPLGKLKEKNNSYFSYCVQYRNLYEHITDPSKYRLLSTISDLDLPFITVGVHGWENLKSLTKEHLISFLTKKNDYKITLLHTGDLNGIIVTFDNEVDVSEVFEHWKHYYPNDDYFTELEIYLPMSVYLNLSKNIGVNSNELCDDNSKKYIHQEKKYETERLSILNRYNAIQGRL